MPNLPSPSLLTSNHPTPKTKNSECLLKLLSKQISKVLNHRSLVGPMHVTRVLVNSYIFSRIRLIMQRSNIATGADWSVYFQAYEANNIIYERVVHSVRSLCVGHGPAVFSALSKDVWCSFSLLFKPNVFVNLTKSSYAGFTSGFRFSPAGGRRLGAFVSREEVNNQLKLPRLLFSCNTLCPRICLCVCLCICVWRRHSDVDRCWHPILILLNFDFFHRQTASL